MAEESWSVKYIVTKIRIKDPEAERLTLVCQVTAHWVIEPSPVKLRKLVELFGNTVYLTFDRMQGDLLEDEGGAAVLQEFVDGMREVIGRGGVTSVSVSAGGRGATITKDAIKPLGPAAKATKGRKKKARK